MADKPDRFTVRMDAEKIIRLKRVSKQQGKKFAEWVRDILLRELGRTVGS